MGQLKKRWASCPEILLQNRDRHREGGGGLGKSVRAGGRSRHGGGFYHFFVNFF